ncbi:MAG: GIY-YIG nuclease family protein [Firmicutes bacterium]|nr:GIY-YIG nuclease family protein [Bacillota bacterium]
MYIYILTNKYNKVFYVGVTNDLIRRIYEHKNQLVKGFSCKYNTDKLVYFEKFVSVVDAIAREKQIKGGSRQDKITLICKDNPEYLDLYEGLL